MNPTNPNENAKLIEMMEALTNALRAGGTVVKEGEISRGRESEPTIPDLAPGLYTLTRDVANPLGDRRVTKEFDRIAVWPKGARVSVRKVIGGKGKKALSVQPHAPVIDTRQDKVIHADSGTVYNTSEGYGDLAAALSREPESVETVIEEVGFESCVDALNALVKSGKVGLDDIRKVKTQ